MAVAVALAAYLYVRLWVLGGALPDPYEPTSATLLVRIADFLAGGALFFAIADAVAGPPSRLIEGIAKRRRRSAEAFGAMHRW